MPELLSNQNRLPDATKALNRARGDIVAVERALRNETAYCHRAISRIDHCLAKLAQ